MRFFRTGLGLSALALAALASACLWDSDALSAEASRFPDLVNVIVGWFPRNPPLYYQMRRDRCIRELKQNPRKLEDYDDEAVVCSRQPHRGVCLYAQFPSKTAPRPMNRQEILPAG